MNTVSIEQLLNIGIALSKEKDNDKLFELILTSAMSITNCDAGTLYIKKEDTLVFKLMFTNSNGTKQGGAYAPIKLPPVPISRKNVCSCSALDGKLINISDVYKSETYDFSGPKNYDKITGYKTTSMLVVPMEDDNGNCIGVLQLINAMDENGILTAFDKSCESVILSLACQTAICLVNTTYSDEIQELLYSIVRVMSTAIDAISPYNANHTNNMVKYGTRFMNWLKETNNKWQFDLETNRQFLMSVLLHDSGKLTVPLDVMNKETRLGGKLQQVMDRFRIIGLLNEISYLGGKLDQSTYERINQEQQSAIELIIKTNGIGFLPDDMMDKIKALAVQTYIDENNNLQPWITSDELISLCVKKGTLTSDERQVMENHVVMTDKILQNIKFPSNYSKVNEWAKSHHEFLDGTGYPLGLCGENISQEVRLLTILDIFDALTAMDRPYKSPMSVEKAFSIMDSMEIEGKIDKNILYLFKMSHAWENNS